ncbi:hypothetical protein VNO80_04994 [Phaseolus coccineus]|uniref:Uncharacterized protein n=1 Tax=Phaseolus coccineus TaxID=3886 RepID=A0AAN9NUQ1_PHACN
MTGNVPFSYNLGALCHLKRLLMLHHFLIRNKIPRAWSQTIGFSVQEGDVILVEGSRVLLVLEIIFVLRYIVFEDSSECDLGSGQIFYGVKEKKPKGKGWLRRKDVIVCEGLFVEVMGEVREGNAPKKTR